MAIQLNPADFEALIFDCDGTLVDTAPAHLAALRAALKAHDLDMPGPWYFERVGLTPMALLDDYEEHFGALPVTRPELLAIYKVSYLEGVDQLEEVTLVADLAREWHGRVPMAVASNGERENVRSSLKSVGLLQLFDTIVAAEDVSRGKPAPDVFLEAARRLKAAPGRCIVLEDSDEGMHAAQAAGMAAIDIRKSWTPPWKPKS